MNGITYNDVKMSFVVYTDSVNQMKDGHAVAFGLGTQSRRRHHGSRRRARHQAARPSPISYDEMRKLNPGYTLVTIPKGTYPKQDKDVKVIGYATHIVVSCKLPEDTVYTMTKTMAQQHQDDGDGRQGDRRADAEGHGARTSACRSIRARRSSTRKSASPCRPTDEIARRATAG